MSSSCTRSILIPEIKVHFSKVYSSINNYILNARIFLTGTL